LERWWHALDELGVGTAVREPRVREPDATALGRAALRAAARDQAVWQALQAMAGDLDAALRESGAAGARIGRRAFQRWLVDASLDYPVPAGGPRGGAVHVLEVRDLPGRALEHVFLGGIADGRFPGRDAPHPLFPDEDRHRVNERCERDVFRLVTGEAARRIPRRLAADRLLFHLALSSSTGTATVSVSNQSADGVEQIPSPFWEELVRLTGTAPRTVPLRVVPPLDEVRSERELRERAALERLAPAALRTEDPDPAGAALERSVGGEPWFGAAAALARIEEERLRFFGDPERPPGPYSGDAGRDDVRAALMQRFRFGPESPLSASKLDRFGECAFRGFLEHALQLSEPDEAGEEIDRRGRGTFWHRVLERLFPVLAERGLLRVAPDAIPGEIVDEAIASAAAKVERGGHTGHPALWRIGQERARRMVRNLLASAERGLPFDGLNPQAAEREFGTPSAPDGWREISLPAPDGAEPVFVRGKIDRLDAGGSAVGVVDYKSGGLEKGKALAEALLTTRFQLPLYLYAARAAGHRGPLDGAWVSLKNGEVVRLSEALGEARALDGLLDTDLPQAVHALVAGLRAGRFPARSDDCSSCSYRRVCRISERALPEEGGNGS
ncbi:MAG TPA: PD-(D/E)XK nuclease family protein, partial [Myxococcaceae bacterium]|nr:PD-(D/E)XK nuclease family protein [Myxococcaceae bacterium]